MAGQGVKPLDEASEAIVNAFALELERRSPQVYDKSQAAKADGALDGLLVHIDRVHDETDIQVSKAVRRLREMNNRHGCTRRVLSDPPCQHPDHWKDVATLRYDLMVLGLPGSLSLLPLAYAEERGT